MGLTKQMKVWEVCSAEQIKAICMIMETKQKWILTVTPAIIWDGMIRRDSHWQTWLLSYFIYSSIWGILFCIQHYTCTEGHRKPHLAGG